MIANCSANNYFYSQALKLSQFSLVRTSIGQMTNLVSNDVNHFDRYAYYIPSVVIAPVQAVTVTAVLWLYLGPSALILTILLILLIPLQGFVGKFIAKYRRLTAQKTDYRIRLINEVVNGIQLIKMSTWEGPYIESVSSTRM